MRSQRNSRSYLEASSQRNSKGFSGFRSTKAGFKVDYSTGSKFRKVEDIPTDETEIIMTNREKLLLFTGEKSVKNFEGSSLMKKATIRDNPQEEISESYGKIVRFF